MSKIPSHIRKIVASSNNGNLGSTYQLVQIYEKGIGVNADDKMAENYKELCRQQLDKGYQFRLKSLKLFDFKGISELTLDFPDKSKVNVFVGNNGSGKSSILDAIKKLLTHISARLATQSYNGDLIEPLEISNGGANSSTIVGSFNLNTVKASMELKRVKGLTLSKDKGKYTEINDLTKLLKAPSSAGDKMNFPLLASYTVDRANDVTTRDIEKSDEIIDSHVWDQAKAYSKSLNGKSDFKLFFRWFKELVEFSNDNSTVLNRLQERLKAKQEEMDNPLIKALVEANKDSEQTKALLSRYQEEITLLKEEINNVSTLKDKTLEVVCDAIYKFIPEFSNLKIQRQPLDLVVTKNNMELSVLQLSQGEKSLLSLVADIARRLTLLNPSLDNPLTGTGIVLIDEIDLHLHPSWQQTIVPKLLDTFPNIQFFISTHSPQVCHTLDSESVWVISEGKTTKAPKGLRGSLSSWVLSKLFYVEARPPEDSFTKLLNQYREMVLGDRFDELKAKEARKTLGKHFGNDYDELVELDLFIENKRWELDFEKDQ